MSDLAATNCGNGCGCDGGVATSNNSCLWIIILLLFCGNGCGNGCGSSLFGSGNDCSCIILILLLLGCGGCGFGC